MMRKAFLILTIGAGLYFAAQAGRIAIDSFVAVLQKSDARMEQVDREIFQTGKEQ